MPSGAVSSTDAPSARQITGSAPLRCCSGPATLYAKPYDVSANTISSTPNAWPSPGSGAATPGHAISTAPVKPTARPTSTPRAGRRRASRLATAAANSAVAPFSMPVSADDTCCSANGNMLSGNASHRTPRPAVFQRSARRIGRRAAGIADSVRNPIRIRRNVTPFGPTDSSPSAMKRNDAPQMQPGRTRSSQSITIARLRRAARRSSPQSPAAASPTASRRAIALSLPRRSTRAPSSVRRASRA